MHGLAEEQRLTLDMVRRVADREIAPQAKELDKKGVFPGHARGLFAELGLLNLLLPSEYDGPGLGVVARLQQGVEELGGRRRSDPLRWACSTSHWVAATLPLTLGRLESCLNERGEAVDLPEEAF